MTPALADFAPLPWQRAMLLAALGERMPGDLGAIRGGVGSGKSLTLCALAALLCETRPGATVVLGMDSYRRLRDVHIPHLSGLLAGSPASHAIAEQAWVWPSGSRLVLAHLDTPAASGPGSSPIEGVNAHAVLVDECQVLRPDVLDVARSRSRVPVADLAGVTRRPLVVTCGIPVEPAWWVERTREAGGAVYLPASAANAAHLGAGWLDRMRETLDSRSYQALVENRPLPPVGSVYYAWEPERCATVEAWDAATMRTALVLDWGVRHPCAILAVETGRGRWHIIREWAPDDEALPDFVARLRHDIVARRHWTPGDARLPVDLIIADPAGVARSSQTGDADVDVVARPAPVGLGMRPRVETDPARRDIVSGATRVNMALQRGALTVDRALYEAGLRAPASRRTLARAMSGYRWDERHPGRPAKDGTHDHHADCVRYLVREVAWDAPMEREAPRRVEPTRGRASDPDDMR